MERNEDLRRIAGAAAGEAELGIDRYHLEAQFGRETRGEHGGHRVHGPGAGRVRPGEVGSFLRDLGDLAEGATGWR